ncbi:cell division cycle-associated protein 3 [Chanos chanos]|uniref:Cell division cycle-associated protein 3 n=1 Tax=Chanos chanos TaxID=29144 RepID=A0A6J2WC31_CHACN|nr:cell division cycle-associated protein 3 [Chanos chanos]
MGSSESKMKVASTPKPEPNQRLVHQRVAQLADPRSPSTGINRTPIQVGGTATHVPVVVQSAGPTGPVDPRSPTVGIVRTPMKDSVRVTVSSLARRLSALFLNEPAEGDIASVTFSKQPSLQTVEQQQEEEEEEAKLAVSEPLLPDPPVQERNSSTEKAGLLSTPVLVHLPQDYGSLSSSPFMLISEEVQNEVEVVAELSVEEAEEALTFGDSPLKKELSLSLLTCHDGLCPAEIYPSVSAEERPLSPLPPPQPEDHPYALPSIQPPSLILSEAIVAPEVQSEAIVAPEVQPDAALSPEAPVAIPVQLPEEQCKVSVTDRNSASVPSPGQLEEPNSCPASHGGFRCPLLDTQSPSQAVFKPQWLGVGFGTTGVRARGVQGRSKGGAVSSQSSLLSSRKPAGGENKGVVPKQKQKGKTLVGEGRSPLQILREANSPRDTSQLKLKISTPEKRRMAQMDRRVLSLSLNKENQ